MFRRCVSLFAFALFCSLLASAADFPAGPMQEKVKAACTTCHNKESPSYKPFCFKKRTQEIAHLDPRDTKAAEDLKNVSCDCDECKKAGGK